MTVASIIIRAVAASEQNEWQKFVADSPESSFFHQLPWREIVEKTLGHRSYYRCAWRDNRLVGVLPLTEIRSLFFGHSLVSPGFGVCAGIAALDVEIANALAADAASLGRSLGCEYVELRHEEPRSIDWLTPEPRFSVFRRRLSTVAEENMKAIPRKKRADLRKAIGNSALRVEHGKDFETFFRLYSLSLRNLGTPILPRDFYAMILRSFGDDVEITVVHGPGGPLAAVMTFYFRDTVLPYYGGATLAARSLHAYDLLYWSVMCRAVERGMRLFDFGRSRVGGSAHDYKSYWGFEARPLHYQYHLGGTKAPPHLGPDNPKYRIFVDGWKRLPVPLANRFGPFIARQLG